VPVFVLVVTVVIGSVILFRKRAGQEDQDGPPIHGNTRLGVIGPAAPAALTLGLGAYPTIGRPAAGRPPAATAPQEINVAVKGQQFAWTFTYPKEVAGGEKPLSTTDVVLAEDRSVKFDIESEDVIHVVWVPAFSWKIDAVPGITTHYRVTPTRRGTDPVVCAELCGLGHSVMRSTVRVVSEPEFKKWLSDQN
jgi:cytochrome c oxidase subunit 2